MRLPTDRPSSLTKVPERDSNPHELMKSQLTYH
jgi:hypothetical protein